MHCLHLCHFLLLSIMRNPQENKVASMVKGGVSEKGNKIKIPRDRIWYCYRWLRYETKRIAFRKCHFFSIKSLSPSFLNWKKKIFLVEEKLRMDNMLHACWQKPHLESAEFWEIIQSLHALWKCKMLFLHFLV